MIEDDIIEVGDRRRLLDSEGAKSQADVIRASKVMCSGHLCGETGGE